MLDFGNNWSWVRYGTAIVLVLLLAGVIPLVLRARGRFGKAVFGDKSLRRLRLIERTRLAPRVDAFLIGVDDTAVMVVVAPSGVSYVNIAPRPVAST